MPLARLERTRDAYRRDPDAELKAAIPTLAKMLSDDIDERAWKSAYETTVRQLDKALCKLS